MSAAGSWNGIRGCLLGFLLAWAAPVAPAQAPASPDGLPSETAHAFPDAAAANRLLAAATAGTRDDVATRYSYANEALALATRARWLKGEMDAERILGECYIQVSAYEDAVAHLEHSRALARKLARQDVERNCLQLLIHCYHMTNRLEQAAAYQKFLLDLTAQTGDYGAECRQMSAYALRLSDLDRDAEAVRWLQRAVTIAEVHVAGDPGGSQVADLLNTLATIYTKLKRTDSALRCLRNAASLAGKTNDSMLLAYICSSICDAYAAAEAYDSAIFYGERTLRLGKAFHNLDLQRHYAQLLSRLYKATRQPDVALRRYMEYDSLSALISNTQRTIDQAMQLAKINMEQQAAMNALEKASFETTRKTNRTVLAAALALILILIVLIGISYRSLRQKQKSNTIISRQANSLQRQNELTDAALKAKELMLRETHHRIKNNLQLISSLLELQVVGLDDAHAANALRTAQRRIQSIAIVHSKLYGSGEDERIELSGFVSDLFARLAHAFSTEGCAVRFENALPPTHLQLDVVVLLGLILNEFITNTFKHACDAVANPAVHVLLATAGDAYVLEYTDTGASLPQGLFEAPTGSLGLSLVKRLSKQLKGTATYAYDGRNRFRILFRPWG